MKICHLFSVSEERLQKHSQTELLAPEPGEQSDVFRKLVLTEIDKQA